MGNTLQVEYVTGGDVGVAVSAGGFGAQSFIPTTSFNLSAIWFPVGWTTTSALNINVALYNCVSGIPDGTALSTGSFVKTSSYGSVTGVDNYYWQHCDMTEYILSPANQYIFTAGCPSSGVNFFVDWTSPTYSDGTFVQYKASTGWAIKATYDQYFQIYGATQYYPRNATTTKTLVAIGGNEVWYESPAGTMVGLAASTSILSTAYPCTAWEGMEKCFVANGLQRYIVDFGNVKLETAAIGTNVPDRSNILTGSSSSAAMVVDYITSATGSAILYGKQTTTTSFLSTDTVSGTNDAGDAVSFTLTGSPTDPPHMYEWTPFANDTATYGTMPEHATIGCLYRGRCVLAGNINKPHMWYMSKVINPWTWLYDAVDPLTAIRGGNSDAGEIGDLITALIPFSDDYLVMGCDKSLWIMRGDPASGGTIDLLSNNTGIYSQTAWCVDDSNTLYFFGTNGIYSIDLQNGNGVPVNISNTKIPTLISDWAIDRDSHRIVLSYDNIRKGILISKTTIDSGENQTYYFDLNVNGFFYEIYPDNLGPCSSFFYKATNDTYTKLLLGAYDGYIYTFDDSEKSDEDTADAVISSYVALPIMPIVPDDDAHGVVKEVIVETAGGASSGAFADTDGCTISFYTGDDPETVLEDIKDDATAFLTVALVSTGRQPKIREHIYTKYLGIKLSNSVISSTWAVNRVFGQVETGGKL